MPSSKSYSLLILIVYGMGTQSQILSDTESISSSNMPFPEISHTTNYKHAINDKQTLSSFTTTERGVGDNVAYASNSLLSNGDSVLSSTSKSTQFKPTIISFGTIPVLHGHTSLAEASPTTRTAPESSTKISLTDKSSTASSILPAPKEVSNNLTTTYNSLLEVRWNEDTGYKGAATNITCQKDGNWSEPTECILIDCEKPTPPTGYIVSNSNTTTYNISLTVRCNVVIGYKGAATNMTCQKDGSWSKPTGCILVDCKKPTPPTAYVVSNSNATTYNSSLTVRCNEVIGYKGAATNMICQKDGKWSKPTGCILVDCKKPTPPTGYVVSNSNATTYNSSLTVRCNEVIGYKGAATNMICQKDGKWSKPTGCILVDCKKPTPPTGYVVSNSNATTYNSSLTVRCNIVMGYKGAATNMICQKDGKWSKPTGCILVDCKKPTPPTGYVVSNSNATTYNSSLTVRCNEVIGYKGAATNMICQKDGKWSKPTGCILVDCEKPTPPTGYVVSDKFPTTYNSSLTVHCNEDIGYKGATTNIICQKDGNWSKPTGCILFVCPPVFVTNASLSSDNEKNIDGTTVKITCNNGYVYQGGESTLVCSADDRTKNATWNGHVGKCLKRPENPKACSAIDQTSYSVELSLVAVNTDFTEITYDSRFQICTTYNNTQDETICNVIGLLSNKEYSFTIVSTKQYRLNGTVYNITSGPCRVNTRTAPASPESVIFNNYSETSLNVSWTSPDITTSSIAYMVQVVGDLSHNDHTQNTFYKFLNLTSGTMYNVSIIAYFNDSSSENKTTLQSDLSFSSTYTKPTQMKSISVSAASVSYITLKLNVNDDRFSSVLLNISNKMSNCSPAVLNNNTLTVTCTNLEAMTVYTVEGYTRAGNIYGSPYKQSVNTAPNTPQASVFQVERTSISINITDDKEPNVHLDYFYLLSAKNATIPINESISSMDFSIDNLIPGTYYTVTIYSSFFGWPCEQPWTKGLFTVPSLVKDLAVTPINSTVLNVSWEQGIGSYEYFNVEYNDCKSPDKAFDDKANKTKKLSSIRAGLLPGTYCNVSVTAHAGNQTSGPQFSENVRRTYETAPSKVSVLDVDKVVNQSQHLAASWKPPSTKNGIIRAYIVMVFKQLHEGCVSKYYFNCSNCEAADNQRCEKTMQRTKPETGTDECELHQETFNSNLTEFHLDIGNLLPYTQYTVLVAAVTSCEGPLEPGINTTDEDVPGAPGSPNLLSTTSGSLYFNWTKPMEPNGVITEYMIIYEFNDRLCRGHGNKIRENKTITDIVIVSMNTSYVLDKLHPFWNYTILIKASNSKGYGPVSSNGTFITSEAEPGTVNRSEIITAPEAYKINLTWKPPCFSNGDIIYYNISWCNKNKASDKGSNVSQTAQLMFTNVLPYRNYTFKIAAVNNRSQGQYSEECKVQSKIAEPFPPKNIKADAVSSTKVNVIWDLLRDDQYTGPTSYTARAYDNNNSSLVHSCEVEGFNATSCEVDELDQYWNYTVDVTAYTQDSHTTLHRNSDTVQTVTTKEDRPGSVINITALPESDVKKPRSITVFWHTPRLRDLNGKLTNYFVTYQLMNSDMVKTSSVMADKTKVVLEDIKPGTYNITVFAATKAGNGTVQTPQTDIIVSPGAPIKPEETTTNQLVQKASYKDLDSQSQLAVSLNRQAFLCNATNGMPTMWGIIVAQSSEAKGTPFYGLKKEYQGILSEYKSWYEIKDSDNIVPYRVTGDTWNPSCSTTDTRSRRSTNASASTQLSPLEFVVGKDEDCAGRPTKFCNGQLPPGRSFRVKTFVCTDGGCTETEFSTPIQTANRLDIPESASDPTVAIVAGVVSGIVVVACVLIVVYLKRRGKVCFAKTIEEPTFEPELELKGTTKFRPVVVKLADFPAYVDAMHRDSGLLFADGFRLLKEQSPSHATSVAEIQACRPKTRYTNILPFDHSRVKLLPLDDEEGSDFINANFIPGYTSRREYIATQGPLPATKDDFWRMVWEQNVDIIVMLTRCVEKGKRKCDEYWPEVVQEPVYSGDLILNVQSESTLSDYVIRIIEIKLKEQTRTVRQLAFLKWPDMGSPDDSEMLLSFVKAVRQLVKPGNSSPMIVHCSAGVGRTGTFIAVDRLLQHIRDHDDVDVYSTILDMRNYRCNMVQTEDQFVYIYECIKDFITTDDEDDEEEEDDDHLYENTRYGDNIYENTAFQKE